MAYLGPPPSQKLATPTSQYFSGNGSATAFTLNRPVNVAEDLNVFVNNVAQQPGSGKSYTATGTTLTFDAAPDAGTNNVYVVYRGLAEPTTRLEHPSGQPLAATTGTFSGNVGIGNARTDGTLHVHTGSAGTVAASTQADDLVVENSAEGGITIATPDASSARIRFTSPSTNTDVGGATIFYRQNINKMNVGTAVSGGKLDLLSGAGVSAILADGDGNVTMPNQPAFHAYGTGNSWVIFSNGSWTKLVLDATPPLNIGSHYDSTNSKFIAPVAGVYHFYYKVYGRVQSGAAANTYWQSRFQKNNNAITGYSTMLMGYLYNGSADETATYSMTISLAATDEITVHAQATATQNGEYYPPGCEFGGYLIG